MASEKDRDAGAGANESMITSRRTFLLVAGAASCVAVTGGVVGALSPFSKGSPLGRSGQGSAARSALARTLSIGTVLHTATVAAVYPIRLGAVAVVMRRPDASAFQLDVLARSDEDHSIAQSLRCSVFAVNGGTGHSVTSEPDGLAAMALARVLADAEQRGMAPLDLLTHADRARTYPAGAFEVSV